MARTVCKNCLIDSKCPDTTIDANCICNFCHDVEKGVKPLHYQDETKRKQFAEELDTILKNTRGTKDYDCVVGFSGGKDSIYLLHKLRKDYPNLRIIAATIDMYFMNKNAYQNFEMTLEKLNIDHVIISYRKSFYKKFYKYLLEHRPEYGYKKGLEVEKLKEEDKGLCIYCGQVMHGYLLKYAHENQIPLVLKGYSPGQPVWMYFEEEVNEDHTPPFMYQEPFTEEDRNYCWNPKKYPEGTKFPRILAPLHVWDYNVENIKKEIISAGLTTEKNYGPAETNCYLNFFMTFIDYRLNGYFNMLPYISYLIRNGFGGKEAWTKTIRIVNFFAPLTKHPKIKEIEKKLGVNADELLAKYKAQKAEKK